MGNYKQFQTGLKSQCCPIACNIFDTYCQKLMLLVLSLVRKLEGLLFTVKEKFCQKTFSRSPRLHWKVNMVNAHIYGCKIPILRHRYLKNRTYLDQNLGSTSKFSHAANKISISSALSDRNFLRYAIIAQNLRFRIAILVFTFRRSLGDLEKVFLTKIFFYSNFFKFF